MPAKTTAERRRRLVTHRRGRARRRKGQPQQAIVVNMIPKALSGETNQDSEPHLTVNPVDPSQIIATAFTPDPLGGSLAPVYMSLDGGHTWSLNPIVPSTAGSLTGTRDITTSFNVDGTRLYAGILHDPRDMEFLRAAAPVGLTPMTVLKARPTGDQPFVHATTVTAGPDAGQDRVYIGDNDKAAMPLTATVDQTLSGQAAAPTFTPVRVENRRPKQDGPQVRPVTHADGTVYAAFYSYRDYSVDPLGNAVVTLADLVVVRDDNWGTSASPFTALKDSVDSVPGQRVVQGISFPYMIFGAPATGQQRIGGSIAIAVDPNDSSIVWLAWGDSQPSSILTLHVRRSTDRGRRWSPDLFTKDNAVNAALAITANGVLGFLCQEFSPNQGKWTTALYCTVDGRRWSQTVLASVPAGTPPGQFNPYLGDYEHMVAVGTDLYGIFSASNIPDQNNFRQGVAYQRNADFNTQTLLDVDNVTPVAVSIDPFFFKITPNGRARRRRRPRRAHLGVTAPRDHRHYVERRR